VLAGLLAELRLRRPDLRPVVLSRDPAATRVLHGVDAAPRSPGAVWATLAGARLLISGGGSLVQDVTSARSALYYLGTILAASWRGVPVAVVGQGIGPLRRPWIRRITRVAFDGARVISVRDAGSVGMLADLGVARPIHQGADLALLMPPPSPDRVHALVARAGLDGAKALIGVAIRPWPGLLDPQAVGQLLGRFAAAHGAAIGVLVFDRVRDQAVSRALTAACGGRIVEVESPADLLGVTGALDLVLGVRLHALIFGASQSTPMVGMAYDPKVTAFMSGLGLPDLAPVDASVGVLEAALSRAWARRVEIRTHLQALLPTLRRAAASGVQAALEAIEAPPEAPGDRSVAGVPARRTE
jgi:polysaccharide pyruvyl transferase CsaB